MRNLLRFFADSGIKMYNFAVLKARKSGEGSAMMGGDRPRDVAEVEKSRGWAFVTNKAGANVYFRPARQLGEGDEGATTYPYVFLDDLSPATAAGIVRKYRSVIVETSHDNFQAWIITAQPLTEEQRHQAQAALAGLVGADQSSTSGEHFGRAPGYRNNKPGRDGHMVVVAKINAAGPALDVGPYIATNTTPPLSPLAKGGRVPSPCPPDSNTDADESAKEYRYALNRLNAGEALDKIINNIAERAYRRGKRATREKAFKYSRLTVMRAQFVTGRL